MSYCLAVKVSAGLVFASDSRNHAGVDQVSTYSKMHVFDPGGDRFFVVLSAGNLATTQALVHRLRSDIVRKERRVNLATVDYICTRKCTRVGRTRCGVASMRCLDSTGSDDREIASGCVSGVRPQEQLAATRRWTNASFDWAVSESAKG